MRRRLAIPGYATLADVGFDGPWVCPYQIMSRSPDGPVLVALHWLDAPSITLPKDILRGLGHLPGIPFNRVLDRALELAGLDRQGIYVTQTFHLIPARRSEQVSRAAIDISFDQVTRHELRDCRVIALGQVASGACRRHGVDHAAVCHPSQRGRTFEARAVEICAALRG
jgi:hypothetical protein